MNKDLSALQKLAQMVLDSELERLRAISTEQAHKAAQIKSLRDARRTRDEILLSGPDMAQFAGVDVRWNRWIAREQQKQAVEAAQIAARREAQLEISRKAFGRAQVLGRLASKK